MAAPIIATTPTNAFSSIYVNLHSLQESGAGDGWYTRLLSWRSSFFAAFDPDDPAQLEIARWVIPTSALLYRVAAGSKLESEVEPLLGLIQNTLYAVVSQGYSASAAQEAVIVAAFNAAWT